MKSWIFFRSVLWALLLGSGPGLCPPGAHAAAGSRPDPAALAQAVASASANRDSGMVDIQGDEPGDRFVDEDGDGLDDRHMRRRHRRHLQRWHGTDPRGGDSEHGETGSGGQAGGRGAASGRGGR